MSKENVKKVISEYEQIGLDFLKKWNMTFSAKFIEDHAKFPTERKHNNDRAQSGQCHDVYRVSFFKKNPEDDGFTARTSFKFYQSIANSHWNGFNDIKEPTAYEVLACICKDDPGTFENFCDEYGYDNDSIKDRKVWRACVNEWKKVELFFGFDTDCLEELREIQ